MNLDILKYRFLFYFIAAVSFSPEACNNKAHNKNHGKRLGSKEMESVNTYLVQKDRDRIRNYIERKNLKMIESPSGLWYYILKEGTGDKFKENDRITMEYECSLLDGTKCYSSKETGPKSVILGKSNIETGLAEGLKLLRPGSEAIFIIPPYLAWGLLGDDKAIPPRSTIVYRVKILNNIP